MSKRGYSEFAEGAANDEGKRVPILTKWSPTDIPSSLPPAPPIADPVLAKAVFTHPGKAIHGEMDYERLEWLGDAYLELMATIFVHETFPTLPAGRCSQKRELLIRNKTLRDYTLKYGFDKRLELPSEFTSQGDEAKRAKSTSLEKIHGDVFEAYVAGVILSDSDGLSNAAAWMKSLWSSELSKEIKAEHRTQGTANRPMPLPGIPQFGGSSDNISVPTPAATTEERPDLDAKTQLARLIGAKGVKITYNDIGGPGKDRKSKLPVFTVGCYLEGWGETNLELGRGSAMGKKEAGQKAAQMAMSNQKLMQRFLKKKQDFAKAMMAVQPEGAVESGQ